MTIPFPAQIEEKNRGEIIAPVFKLEEVAFRYNPETIALDRLTFRIEAGQSVALLGANGCGKSTLLKLMGGLIFAEEGHLYAFEEEISRQKMDIEREAHQFRRRVGFVFQNADAQLFCPTVREEIAFGPLHLGLSREETLQRVEDIARMLHLERFLERAPFQLSGGEKRRVALGCTLAVNPDVILLDEPTTGLDPRSREDLMALLNELRTAGKTLVITTHELELVPAMADRALVLSEDHSLAADLSAANLFDDLALLERVNLIHNHSHRHGNTIHAHSHFHGDEHEHDHSPAL